MNLAIYICTLLFIATIAGMSIFIKKLIGDIPVRIHEKNMEAIKHLHALEAEDMKHDHSKELQIENYFRQISGEKIENLFFEWTDYISKIWSADTSGFDKVKMTSDILRFGSGETVRRLAVLLQFEFSIQDKDTTKKAEDLDNFVWYYLTAYVIVQLKNDFTGYAIDPTDIIKLRLSDYESKDTKEKFEKGQEKAKKLLGIS